MKYFDFVDGFLLGKIVFFFNILFKWYMFMCFYNLKNGF